MRYIFFVSDKEVISVNRIDINTDLLFLNMPYYKLSIIKKEMYCLNLDLHFFF